METFEELLHAVGITKEEFKRIVMKSESLITNDEYLKSMFEKARKDSPMVNTKEFIEENSSLVYSIIEKFTANELAKMFIIVHLVYVSSFGSVLGAGSGEIIINSIIVHSINNPNRFDISKLFSNKTEKQLDIIRNYATDVINLVERYLISYDHNHVFKMNIIIQFISILFSILLLIKREIVETVSEDKDKNSGYVFKDKDGNPRIFINKKNIDWN